MDDTIFVDLSSLQRLVMKFDREIEPALVAIQVNTKLEYHVATSVNIGVR